MSRRRILLSTFAGLVVFFAVLTVMGTREGERPNALVPTMGGAQMWNDIKITGGWRIQQHVGTGHCRLLDENDNRRAWGDLEECHSAMKNRQARGEIGPNKPEMVILVHGLAGYGWTFRTMKPELRVAGFDADLFNYASTRGSLSDHVAAFHIMMNALEGVDEVSFVAHSLGGLLLRQALADEAQPWRSRMKVKGLVMIGTPNQGAVLADRFKDSSWFQAAFKGAGQDLTSGYAATIPVPTVPYFLVAGQLGGEGNPLIPGPDDGMVAVREARIKPTDALLILEASHAALTAEDEAIDAVKSLLVSY
jgi:pimeloyl-ACP methyl ester carboxylesterase